VILAQELITAPGIHDVQLNYPDRRLSEPLALEIARQYADMLRILHSSGITCADRKLSDLRWEQTYALRPEEPDGLDRWRQEESPGHLMVWDWNVTEESDAMLVQVDLFRFGTLWYRLLFGVEPRFRSGEWRLEEPLDRQPGWSSLSCGTQQILDKLLHPLPEHRYRSAADRGGVLLDLDQQVALWKKQPEELWKIVKAEDKPIEDRWKAADLLRVLIEHWGVRQRFPDFDREHGRLRVELEKMPFRPLEEAILRSNWGNALSECDRLTKAYVDSPALLLLVDRYRRVIEALRDNAGRGPDRARLLGYADRLDNLDANEIAELRRWRSEWRDPSWSVVLDRLIAETAYRATVGRARASRYSDLVASDKAFKALADLRSSLSSRGHRDIIKWLDDLYGNPEPDAKAVADEVEQLNDVGGLLEKGLQEVANEVAEPAGAHSSKSRLAEALRRLPGDLILARAYRLLDAEQGWQRVAKGDSLALRLLHLGQWSQACTDLLDLRPETAGSFAVASIWESIRQKTEPSLRALRERRWDEARSHLLDVLRSPNTGHLSQVENEDRTYWRDNLWRLVTGYRDARGALGNDRKFEEALLRVKKDAEQRVKAEKLKMPRSLDEFRDDPARLARVAMWAHYGQMLAELAGQPWPEELTQAVMDKRAREAQGCLAAILTRLAHYFQAA
jgi:hypothetical protein